MHQPLKWWWRGALSSGAFLASLVLLFSAVQWGLLGLLRAAQLVGLVSKEPPSLVARDGIVILGRDFVLPFPGFEYLVFLAMLAVPFLALLTAIALYHRLTFGESILSPATRCGTCGKLLRDLTEPVCPHCQVPL